MLTLTQEKIKEIRNHSVQNYDKWNRMCRGMGSELERCDDGILYLRIRNSEKFAPSTLAIARQFVESWISWNKELRDARGFVVLFYRIQTGELINIFSGLIT